MSARCLVTKTSPSIKIAVKALIKPVNSMLKKVNSKMIADTIIDLGSQNQGGSSPSTKAKNVELDSHGLIVKTDNFGLSLFTVKFLSGMPGEYTFIFNSGNMYSKKTIEFKLLNKITKVEYLRNPGANIKVIYFFYLKIIKFILFFLI